MSQVVTEHAALTALAPPRRPASGSGAVLGLSQQDVWREVMRQLPLTDADRIVAVSDVAEVGALTHLLWWAPSVRAVYVAADDTTDVEDVRRAIELTGSDALLMVEASATHGLAGLERAARWADLVVVSVGTCADDPEPASLLSWSPRVADAMQRVQGVHALSYDVLARFNERFRAMLP
jgi:hypothetical protein